MSEDTILNIVLLVCIAACVCVYLYRKENNDE